MCLLGKDLNRGIFVDGDRSGGDKELFDGAIVLEDGHDSGSQHGQGGNMVGKDTKRSGERGNIDLFDCSVLNYERTLNF
jgi:hypothetical protein